MGGSGTIAFVGTTNANALAEAPVGKTHFLEPCLHCLAFAFALAKLFSLLDLVLAHVFAFIFAFALVASWLPRVGHVNAILDHGMEVGKELAYVLSGGDTNLDKEISEDQMYNLELNSFMKLIETKKTQERILHTLKTGKPLVN